MADRDFKPNSPMTFRDGSNNNPRQEGQRLVSGKTPPLYRIDLDLPPSERHTAICKDFRAEMHAMVPVYDDVLRFAGLGAVGTSCLRLLAKYLVRRVHDPEEMEEIRGIARDAELPVHYVVAINSFLDLFSGCISGGVREGSGGDEDDIAEDEPDTSGRMLHFRGLDWEMDPLRDMVIQVEYVRGGKVVARAVTYAGYVGTLTGVREGLSMSLNYRMNLLSDSSAWKHRWHHLNVLLGLRPSISSQLRTLLLAPGEPPSPIELLEHFKTTTASPCYLTFCSPSMALILENDLESCRPADSSTAFCAVANHDLWAEVWAAATKAGGDALEEWGGEPTSEVLVDSVDRKECVAALWCGRGIGAGAPGARVGSRAPGTGVTEADVREWLRTYPVRNECTHFSCIMDPSQEGGGIPWVETYDNKDVQA